MAFIVNSSAAAQTEVAKRVSELAQLFKEQAMTKAVIAVSGGIDSAVSLGLLSQAVGSSNIVALLLPYSTQDMQDAKAACDWVKVPSENVVVLDIAPIVDAAATQLQNMDGVRLGNLKARARMMMVYDTAKRVQGLVCGTENKSEHYLGYFTRFGDAASDIEPIATLFKTEVRMMADALGVPQSIQVKPPSAGLWDGQTDENELGFSYEEADVVMAALEERGHLQFTTGLKPDILSGHLEFPDVKPTTVEAILNRLYSSKFKLQVPYILYA